MRASPKEEKMRHRRLLQTPKHAITGRPEIPTAGFNAVDARGKATVRMYRQENGAPILLRDGIPVRLRDEAKINRTLNFWFDEEVRYETMQAKINKGGVTAPAHAKPVEACAGRGLVRAGAYA
jgi:hypothetical protein